MRILTNGSQAAKSVTCRAIVPQNPRPNASATRYDAQLLCNDVLGGLLFHVAALKIVLHFVGMIR